MIEIAIIIFISILLGWFLRDLQVIVIEEKAEKIKRKVLPSKAKVLNWEPPKSEEEIAEQQVRGQMKEKNND